MTPTDEHPHEAEVITIADEVAAPVQEAINAAEQLAQAGVKIPFSLARLGVEKLRAAADALETQIRKAGPKTDGGK